MIYKNITKNGFETPNKNSEKVKVEELVEIIEFIKTYFIMRKNINTKHSSYGIKHILERLMNIGVSNGELITAMLICGYKHKRYRRNGLNCHFNVKSINEDNLKELIKNNKRV